MLSLKEQFMAGDFKQREFSEGNIYDPEARFHLLEEDQITIEEEAFMEGYEEAAF